jgi:indole-3-glycerol phosphate synthase
VKTGISPTLSRIISDTRSEIESDKARYSQKRVKQMLAEAPPLISFASALSSGLGMIAEIKERSPSQGKMLVRNFNEAPQCYKRSSIVKAVSVLTNRANFGEKMKLEYLRSVKRDVEKPVLRKDFIFDEYQVYQARAFGADAILLMANILEKEELKSLSSLAFGLGMDVLFETHCQEELSDLPKSAKIVGINCRSFEGRNSFWFARIVRQWFGAEHDASVNTNRFDEYSNHIVGERIKVAESGVNINNCEAVFSLGFQTVLVGTSLLMDKRGVKSALDDFEVVIKGQKQNRTVPVLRPITA